MTASDTLQILAVLVGIVGVTAAILVLQEKSHRRRLLLMLGGVAIIGFGLFLWRSLDHPARVAESTAASPSPTITDKAGHPTTTEPRREIPPQPSPSPPRPVMKASILQDVPARTTSDIRHSPPSAVGVEPLLVPSATETQAKTGFQAKVLSHSDSTTDETFTNLAMKTESVPSPAPESQPRKCLPSCQADFANLPMQRYDLPNTTGAPKAEYVVTLDSSWELPQYVHIRTQQFASVTITKDRHGRIESTPGPPYITHVAEVLLSDSPAKGAVGTACFWILDSCEMLISSYRVRIQGATDPQSFSIVVQPSR